MKITILNGSPSASPFDTYLSQLTGELETGGHSVTLLDLRNLNIHYCTGCFGCWVKQPGECVNKDDSQQVRRAIIGSDFLLWASPLLMGFPTALLKKAMDKMIPLIHPYFEVDRGEAHHRPRYERYPRVGLLLASEASTDDEDMQIVSGLFARTAINMKSRLEFSLTTDTPAAEIAGRIAAANDPDTYVPIPQHLPPLQGVSVPPPSRLTLFNGSPRGSKGNTPIMLTQLGEGFASSEERSFEMHHLVRVKAVEEFKAAFASAECVWLGFPLYTDGMPGIVKTFIEALEGQDNRPPIGFLVQSGFPEALHSRYVERYLQKLAARLGSPYLGTIVKGNGEGVRMLPERANAKLFTALRGLGAGLAQNGGLAPALLKKISGTERYNSIMVPAFKLFVRTPLSSWYWDSQLKENGVYEQRFDQPYADELR